MMLKLKFKLLAALLQFILATTLFNWRFMAATATITPEMAVNDNGALDNGYEEKRSSWQSLQSSWGKRAYDAAVNSMANAADTSGSQDVEAIIPDRWLPVFIASDGRFDPSLQHPLVYLTNAAILEQLANQRDTDTDADLASAVNRNDELLASLEETDGNEILNEKRTWKNMNVAWGKRRNAPAWNKFRGAWGKREPGWNNLKGMWGKRSSKDWQKLHAGWGKRSDNFATMN